MTDRVYASSKTPTKPPQTNTTAAAAAKPHNQPPPYRRQRQRRRTRRCTCCCIFWYSVLILLFISLLAAISGTAFYVLYRPQKPTFSISSLKLSSYNLTTTSDEITHLTSSFNLTLTSQNPNSKFTFHYYPFTASLFSHTILLANGSYPSFTSVPKYKKIMKFKISTFREEIDEESVRNLEMKNGFHLELRLDSKLGVKIGNFKTGKVGIRATCNGIHMVVRKSKITLVTLASGSECKVGFRFKIWEFTI